MNPFFLLEELLRLRRATSEETAELVQYSHDALCREIEEQLHVLLDSFEKYKHIAYLVQGPRDQGVDVLLKGSRDQDDGVRYMGLQVKSYEELNDKQNFLAKQLKAGFVDATSAYGDSMDRYYILLFGDAKKHEKRIAAIKAEFAKQERVRIIDPRNLLAFLRLPASTIAAVVDLHLGEEDYVRKLARAEAAEYTSGELHFLLACICYAFENASDVLPEEFFSEDPRIEALRDKLGNEAVADLLAAFADRDFETYAEPSSTRVRLEHFPAIRALYYDLQVRYDETADELFDHMYEFLRTPEEEEG